jgi:RNA dependent RNA polymerase
MRRLRFIDKRTLISRAVACEQYVDCSIFDSRHALITSIRGNAAEASKMIGGDYDGDRAWICWNSELLSCLPSSDKFVAEDTSGLSTKASELESKLWGKCSIVDLVRYMINFRNHHKLLGELSEHLDCYIDFYGFNDERTRELGKAAFLQVCYSCCFIPKYHLSLYLTFKACI